MPAHAGILGNALSVIQPFFTDQLQKEAAAAFAAASRALPRIEDPAFRERATAAMERERVLFKQWQDLFQVKNTAIPRLNLPLLAQAADFAQSSSRSLELGSATSEAKTYPTEVRAAWTRDALLLKWVCHDPQMRNLKTQAAGRDGKVLEDDSVELALSSGISGETWHLAANSRGVVQDYRYSSVGVREDLWNPTWQAKTQTAADRWEAEMTIPFASLGQTPNPNETWHACFLRHNGGRQDFAPGAFPNKETAMLFFSSAARTDRALLWWSGAPERESSRDAALNQEFTEIGWQLHLVTTEEQLLALHDKCAAFWFRHPNGPNKVPASYWQKCLAPAVKNGALAVFVSYWGIPLDQYFNDPSLKVKVVDGGNIPLAGRRSQFIAPGDWASKPNDLLPRLKTRITPWYGFIPEDAAAWTILATAPREGVEPFPYVLARPYGKGMIILCGDAIPIPAAKMLENFAAYHGSQKTS